LRLRSLASRAALILLLAAAQSYRPTAVLVYEGTEVVVTKTSPDEVGLAWIEDREDGVLFIFYDPPPYRVEARFGEGTRAYAHLALVEQPDEGGGQVVLAAGKAEYDPEKDEVTYAVQEQEDAVEIKKGELQAFGTRLDYDNEEGLARVKGPVRFLREEEEPVSGRADAAYYRLKEDELWLLGGVEVKKGGRTTTADAALYLEKEDLFYLTGDPVISRAEGEEIRGRRVLYSLKTGEIWVLEGVSGKISD